MSLRPSADDSAFIAAFRKGDLTAYDLLFRDYFKSLVLYGYSIIQDKEAAADLVQDCFVSLWKRRQRLSHIDRIRQYLYTAVHHQCVSWLRQRARQRRFESDYQAIVEPSSLRIDDLLLQAELARHVYDTLEQLPPRMQQVVRLYYLEGKSYQEIGDLIGNTPETVRQQRISAIKFLRKIFSAD